MKWLCNNNQYIYKIDIPKADLFLNNIQLLYITNFPFFIKLSTLQDMVKMYQKPSFFSLRDFCPITEFSNVEYLIKNTSILLYDEFTKF